MLREINSIPDDIKKDLIEMSIDFEGETCWLKMDIDRYFKVFPNFFASKLEQKLKQGLDYDKVKFKNHSGVYRVILYLSGLLAYIEELNLNKGRRKTGEGSIYQRSDGRWLARLTVGLKPDGKPKRKSFYGESKQEALDKMYKFKKYQQNSEPKEPHYCPYCGESLPKL